MPGYKQVFEAKADGMITRLTFGEREFDVEPHFKAEAGREYVAIIPDGTAPAKIVRLEDDPVYALVLEQRKEAHAMAETKDYDVTFCDDDGSQYMVELAPGQVRHVPHGACQVAKRAAPGERMTLRMTPARAKQFGIVEGGDA